MALAAGARFGPYEIIALIGTGGRPILHLEHDAGATVKSARTLALVTALVATFLAAGCRGGGTTEPSSTPPPATGTPSPSTPTPPTNGETFAVTGIVTDDRGAPISGAQVTMSHWLGGRVYRPMVLTDASGQYAITFTSHPWTNTYGRAAARAEIVVDAYDWYWRNVLASGPQLVEDFRLHHLKRIAAGESISVSVTPDNGDCTGWLYNPCGRLRVTVPIDGNLTVEAVRTQESAAFPQLEVCCLDGNERYGNPVTLRAAAGAEMWVEIGQSAAGATTGQTVIVKTSLQPF
jgi:hypothetical protein